MAKKVEKMAKKGPKKAKKGSKRAIFYFFCRGNLSPTPKPCPKIGLFWGCMCVISDTVLLNKIAWILIVTNFYKV